MVIRHVKNMSFNKSILSADVTEIPGGEKGLIRVHIVRVPSETDNIFHEERKPLRLTCLSPDGAPVRWERQGGQPLPPDSRVYGLELLFDNPTTDASGTYVCVLERFPTTMSYVVLTIVGGKHCVVSLIMSVLSLCEHRYQTVLICFRCCRSTTRAPSRTMGSFRECSHPILCGCDTSKYSR